jgi:CheY-like chemotaxis protein
MILLVDNDPDTLLTIREFLEAEGYPVMAVSSREAALRILERRGIQLIILDIRLVDDEDEKDTSGLALARELDPSIPKIILTRFPTYQAVRQALGPALDGLPQAVGFVAKQEGLKALLRQVRLALAPMASPLMSGLLQAFQAPVSLALPRRIQEVGPEEASHRLHSAFEATSREVKQYRRQENQRAAQYHTTGLVASALGMTMIVTSVALVWRGQLQASLLPLVASVVIDASGALFFVREDAAHKRANRLFEQLVDLNQVGNVLIICDSLESPADREAYKKKIIEHVLEA